MSGINTINSVISNQNNHQIETKKSYNEIVDTMNSVISNQNNSKIEIKKSDNEIVDTINSVISNQNNSKIEIKKSYNEIVDTINSVISNQNNSAIEMKKSYNEIVNTINSVISNQNNHQIEMKKVQEESVTNIISNQKNHQIEIKKSYNDIVSTINSVVSNQNNILNTLEEIVAVQGNLMKKTNDIPSKDSVRELDIKLDKYSNMTEQIGTQITEVMNSSHNLESNINMISDNIDNVSVNIGHLYSKNQAAFANFFQVLRFINTLKPVILVGGDVPFEGTVIIKHEGRIGTVCDDGWDDRDALVVCRMLGYTGGTAYREAKFGRGTGVILLDDVLCTGDEKSLFDCQHRGIGVNDCSHVEDAGVRCV